jgi:hypothetical protein
MKVKESEQMSPVTVQWLSPVSAPFDGLGETESASSAKDPEHSRAPIYAIHYNTWYASESQTKFLNASPHTATYQRRIAKWSRCKCANLCLNLCKQASSLLWRAMRCNEVARLTPARALREGSDPHKATNAAA